MSRAERRKFLFTAGAILALPGITFAQKDGKVRRIGFLAQRSRSTPSNPDVYFDAFVQGMRELGYVEGKNLIIEWRFADGKNERLPGLAAELVKLNPEVLVTYGTPPTQALQRATSTIPIVFLAAIDPVGSGLASSLARPGRNVTGQSIMTIEISPKQIELLAGTIPGLSRVAVLVDPENGANDAILKSIEAAARSVGVKTLPVSARTADEIERGFATMAKERAQAVIVTTDLLFRAQRSRIVALAMKHRLPSLFGFREDVLAGGLMSYGPDIADGYRRGAIYVDKILKGAKPGELPIEQPTQIELLVNAKTAKALGIRIPQSILGRADRVIE